MTKNFKYSIGDILRDSVTGLEGVVMVCAIYSTGGCRYGLQSRNIRSDGAVPEWEFLDEGRLELVKEQAVVFDTAQ